MAALLSQAIAQNVQQLGGIVATGNVNDPIGSGKIGKFFRLVYVAAEQNQKLGGPAAGFPAFIALHIDVARH